MKTPHSLLVFLALSASAYAGTVTWNVADANNNWNTTDLNWTGGVAFATGDDAVFNSATGETVLVDAGGVAPTSTTVASAGNWTFAIGPISGTLAKSGTGTLTLSNSNSFTATSLTGGSLTLGNVGALGSGTLTVGSGARSATTEGGLGGSGSTGNFLFLSGITGSQTFSNAIVLPVDASTTFRKIAVQGSSSLTHGANTYNFSGLISGGGAGTNLYFDVATGADAYSVVRLSNASNSFIGRVEFNRGSLQIDSDSVLGPSANVLRMDSFNASRLIFNYSGTYSHPTEIATATNFDTGANSINATGVLSGGARLTKIGAGSLTLSNANTYNGTTISNGPNSNTTAAIVIGNNSALGSGSVTVNNTATITALFNGATSRTIANNIALSGTAGLTTNLLAGNNTAFELNGIVSGGTSTSTLFINTNQANGSTGYVKLGNTANTFLGRVQINRGGLAIASDGSLGNAANPITIDIGTTSQIGLRFDSAISSARNILLGASRQLLDTNANDVSLSGVISGTGDLFKASAGKLTLTGANTYTGTTTVNAGTLEIGAGGTTGNISAGAVVNNGVISFNRSNALTLAGNITGTGSLRQDGAGTTTLNGTFPATTALTLNNGTFAFGTPSSAVTTGTVDSLTQNAGSLAIDVDGIASDVLTVTNAYNFTSGGIVLNILGAPTTGVPYPIVNYGTLTGSPTVTVNGLTGSRVAASVDYGTGSASAISVTFSGVIGNLVWTGASNNTWDLATTQNWNNGGSPDSFHILDNIVFDDSPTSGNTSPVLDFIATAGSIVFSNNAKTYTLTGTGGLSGATGIELNGGGTTVIATNNDYAGFTDILGTSTLQIGDGGTSGTLGTGAVYVEGGLVFNRSNDVTVANPISGSGGLTKQGAGILTLTGSNTYGTTTISGGTLRIGDGGTTGTTGSGDIINNGIFGINRSNAVTFTNSISGSGSLLKQGTGLLTLPNANTFGGGTQVQGGTILMSHPDALGAGAISHAGGQLRFSFGDGTTTIIPNAVSLNSTGHATFVVRGTADAAPALPTTVRLTGKISGGAAGQTYQLVDSAIAANHNNVLELRNATNDFQGTIRMERGTLGIDSNAALGHPDNDIEHFTENLNGSLRFDADNIVLGSGRDIIMPGNANSRPVNTQGFTATITGNVSGTGILVKQGSGKLILSGTNSATAATTVAAGTLQVEGNFNTSTAAVTVNTGATLAGSGTISRPVNVAGSIAPGAGTGTITIGNTLTLQPGGAINLDLSDWTGVAGVGFDTISATAVNVTATPVSKFQVRVDASSLVNFTDEAKSFVIATAAAAPTGLAADNWEVIPTGFSGAGEWTVETSGNNLVLVYSLGTPFSNWASSKGLTGLDAGFNADPDADGISNGLEFVLGGEPNPANPGSNSNALRPTFAISGPNMIFTYSRADAAAYLNPVVEFNDLLSGTWTTAIDPANATINVLDGSPSDTVTVTIPTLGSPTKFARLKVEEAP